MENISARPLDVCIRFVGVGLIFFIFHRPALGNYQTSDVSSLKKHTRIHSGVKPFK